VGRGGARIGAGRKTGTTDRKLGKVSAERVLNATGTGPDKMPLAYMLAVMNDKNQKASVRLQAAIAAAPYVHPKLASVEVKSDRQSSLAIESDLGKALRELAEITRLRSASDVIEGEILEPATMQDQDTMSTIGNDDDTMSGMVLAVDDDEAEEGGEERPENDA
jgi:uncharacterized membrane protein